MLTETWEHMRDLGRPTENGGDVWPEARCGAVSLSSSPDGSPPVDTHHQEPSTVSFVGGWGGPSSGECEEWPHTNNRCASKSNGTAHSGECLYKSFRSKDLPTLPTRHSRAYAAVCEPLEEVWDFRLHTASLSVSNG